MGRLRTHPILQAACDSRDHQPSQVHGLLEPKGRQEAWNLAGLHRV